MFFQMPFYVGTRWQQHPNNIQYMGTSVLTRLIPRQSGDLEHKLQALNVPTQWGLASPSAFLGKARHVTRWIRCSIMWRSKNDAIEGGDRHLHPQGSPQ